MNDELLKSILESLQGINNSIQEQNSQLERLNENFIDINSKIDSCIGEYNGHYWFNIGGNINV